MSPIYYANLRGQISTPGSKKIEEVTVKGIVVKGTVPEIKVRTETKKTFLRDHFKSAKKALDFDLTRLKIIEVEIIESLGYGIVEN